MPSSTTSPTSSQIVPARGGSQGALHTTGTGFTMYGGGFGVVLVPQGLYSLPVDASAYRGITFWAKGTTASGLLTLELSTAETVPNCGYCTNCYDNFKKSVALTADWTQYTINWSEVVQAGYGVPQVAFNPAHLTNINFITPTSWDFWIDDPSFVP